MSGHELVAAALADTAPSHPPLTFVSVGEFAAVEEEGAEPLVVAAQSTRRLRAVIPAGSLSIVYGDGGAGKTTLLVDLAMHFAAGIPWCGLLEPVRPLRVAWIENEGPRPMMRQKFAGKLDAWRGPPVGDRLLVQTEPWARFTFRDETHRAELARAIDETRTDLLIAGPLGRLGMEGAGTSDDIRVFLDLVEAAWSDCERRPALLVVHHENRAGQISGAWEREPDTLVHVQGQGHGRTRVLWQKARWASDLHGTSTQLVWSDGEGFTVDERPDATPDTMADEILAAVRDYSGSSWSTIRKHVRGRVEEAAAVRDRLLAQGKLVNTAAREGHFNLALPDTPNPTRSELGTGWERLSFPSPGGEPEPTRSPVPYVVRNGERERNGRPGVVPHNDRDRDEAIRQEEEPQ